MTKNVTLYVSIKRVKGDKYYYFIKCKHDNDPAWRSKWIEMPFAMSPEGEDLMKDKIILALLELVDYQTKEGTTNYKMIFDQEYSIAGDIYQFPNASNKKWVDFKKPLHESDMRLFFDALCSLSDRTY